MQISVNFSTYIILAVWLVKIDDKINKNKKNKNGE